MRRRDDGSILLLLGFALALNFVGCTFTDDIDKLVVPDIKVSAVKDGTYRGEQDNKPVTAEVEVDVAAGAITAIKVLKHGHGPGHGADAIVDRVVAAQSLKVDAVSGASFSSKVMLMAIGTALEKGL